MRLIDADALFAKVKERHDMYAGCEYVGDKARRDELSAFMADIVNTQTVGGWISVKDELPRVSGRYLVSCVSLGMESTFSAEWLSSRRGWYIETERRMATEAGLTVTHWMRLPEPPKGGEVGCD
jgi:hypothetical protein